MRREEPSTMEVYLAILRETEKAYLAFEPEEQTTEDAVWIAKSIAKETGMGSKIKNIFCKEFEIPLWVAKENGWI